MALLPVLADCLLRLTSPVYTFPLFPSLLPAGAPSGGGPHALPPSFFPSKGLTLDHFLGPDRIRVAGVLFSALWNLGKLQVRFFPSLPACLLLDDLLLEGIAYPHKQ